MAQHGHKPWIVRDPSEAFPYMTHTCADSAAGAREAAVEHIRWPWAELYKRGYRCVQLTEVSNGTPEIQR